MSNKFDVIIVGTGLTQSILASATALIGKKILHIDSLNYYGQNWASFDLHSFNKWLNTDKMEETELDPTPTKNKDEIVTVRLIKRKLFNVEQKMINHTVSTEMENTINENLYGKFKDFNIDISPHMIFSNGSLVSCFSKTRLKNYMYFKNVEENYLYLNNFLKVPCSKAEIFKNENINLDEKRKLNKLLKSLLTMNDYTKMISIKECDSIPHEEDNIYKSEEKFQIENNDSYNFIKYINEPFSTLCNDLNITEKSLNYIVYSIAFLDINDKNKKLNNNFLENISENYNSKYLSVHNQTLDILSRLYLFVSSCGKYSDGAVIYPEYGISSIVQSFCRLCAVYDGVYKLNYDCKYFGLSKTKNGSLKFKGIFTNESDMVEGDKLVIGSSYLKTELLCDYKSCRKVMRMFCVTDKPLDINNNKTKLNNLILTIPPNSLIKNKYAIRIIQLDSSMKVCPKNYYILYMSTIFYEESMKDLKDCSNKLLNKDLGIVSTKPNLLISAIYSQQEAIFNREIHYFENVYAVDDSDADFAVENSVRQAKEIFKMMYPEEMFFEKERNGIHGNIEKDKKDELFVKVSEMLERIENGN